jgi:hypothetical protein
VNDFLKATLTPQKFRGLAVNTAFGNFAGYLAGSAVTLFTTYHSIERRALRNLFGILPRKKVVVHLLPEWLEWVLALVIGFLVMEFVRYWVGHRKYEPLLRALRGDGKQTPPADQAHAAQNAASGNETPTQS